MAQGFNLGETGPINYMRVASDWTPLGDSDVEAKVTVSVNLSIRGLPIRLDEFGDIAVSTSVRELSPEFRKLVHDVAEYLEARTAEGNDDAA